jgi:signal transduction histidine kinase/PAS domain-containing protein
MPAGTAAQPNVRALSERQRLEGAREELRRLLAITDTALAHPQLDALLDALLARIHDVLAVDNVAILLAEDDERTLVVHAASGPEAEVVGGVHVPVGRGFAGRIAATRAPLVVEDLTAFPVVNPLLHERLRSVAGVPFVVEGRLVGVLHIGSATPRRFTEDEVHLLQLVGERVALAVDHARRAAAERQAHTEAAARAAELETTIEAMVDAVGLYDAEGHMVRANSAMRRLLALEADPVYLSLSPDVRVARTRTRHPDGRPLSPEEYSLTRLLRGEVLTSDAPMELVVTALDGQEVWLSITGAPLRADDGRVVGAVAVARDVTERRRLEQHTKQALEALLEMAQVLVERPAIGRDGAEADSAAVHPTMREVAQRLAELTCEVLTCKRVSLVLVDEATGAQSPLVMVGASPEEERHWQTAEAQRRFGAGSDPAEHARFRAGEVMVVDMRRPPRAGQANPYGIRSVVAVPMVLGEHLVGTLAYDYGRAEHEYTDDELALAGAVGRLAALAVERERLLREREEAWGHALALQESNRRMEEFLGVASHELKTPLTALLATADMLHRRLRAAAAREGTEAGALAVQLHPLVERMQHGFRRLDRLVSDLLDTTRIHEGKLELRQAPCDLGVLVRDMVEEQRELQPLRAIHYRSPRASMPVVADAERLGQVVANYLSNALKYSAPDRPVEVRLEMLDNEARVAVRDEGPGLPPQELASIWERFYQVAGVRHRSGSGVGLGLGLYISKSIVERHGGQVGVESQVGNGSTFWFTLPLAVGTGAADVHAAPGT